MEKEKKTRKPQRKVHVGDVFGTVEIIGDGEEGRTKKWKCRCTICGSEFTRSGQDAMHGICPECSRKQRRKNRIEEYRTYIGNVYGDLKIIDFAGPRMNGSNRGVPEMLCMCQKCGQKTIIALSRIKAGGAKQCANCARKNLLKGSKADHVAGVTVSAAIGARSINKNNKSGVTGVCFDSRSGLWRAYIDINGRHYELGRFNDIDKAIERRKAAEAERKGDFLEWYKQAEPEGYNKIIDKINKQFGE